MKKTRLVLCFLASLCAALLLCLPAHAEGANKGSLRSTCNLLDSYMYPIVYQEEQGYEEFLNALTEAKNVTVNIASTDEEVQAASDNLRDAYFNLMHNTYDYSGLESIVEIEKWLNASIYEESGYEAFTEQVENCRSEFNTPRIYDMGTKSVIEYRNMLQSKIDEAEKQAVDAYNELKLKKLPADYTVSILRSIFNASSPAAAIEEFRNLEGWGAFSAARDAASKILDANNSEKNAVNRAAKALVEGYVGMLKERFSYSIAERTVKKIDDFKEEEYTASSWANYKAQISALKTSLSQPVFFYAVSSSIDAEKIEILQRMIDALPESAENAAAELVPLSAVQELKDLCEKYKNVAVSERLEQLGSALIQAVEKGNGILARDDASMTELRTAKEAIEGAADQLILASESIQAEETKEQSDRDKEVKLIFLFTIVTLIASVGLAVFFSLRKNGETSWTN